MPFGVGLLWLLLLIVLGSAPMFQWSWQSLPWLLFLLGCAFALYVVPGLALLRLLARNQALGWTEQIALAGGVGLAIPPLLLEVAHLVGLSWGRWTTISYVVIAGTALIWTCIGGEHRARRWPGWSWSAAMLAGVVAVGLLVRLYIVRDLPAGMWGDSYHHTMIAQLLVDNGGLFTSWEPYAPLVTFTYHYGFHANVAFFHWLSGYSVPLSIVYVGQFINLATLPLAYVLTAWLSGNRAAGVWAALLTGFVNTQPAFYVNWGRYTQLTGQAILPAALIAWMLVVEAERLEWRRILLATLVTSSLMLTHYIVTIFAALFLASYVLVLILRRPQSVYIRTVLFRSMVTGLCAVLLALPWLLNTLRGYLGRNVAGFVSKSVGQERLNEVSTLAPLVPLFLTGFILLLAVLGLALALSNRSWRVGLLGLWSILLIWAIVPHVFGLPGTGVVNTFTAFIALYLPVVPLAGYAVAMLQSWVTTRSRLIGYGVATAGIAAVTVWGAQQQQRLLDPKFQLLMPADVQAMNWIRQSTPSDALFLVNMFPAYDNSLFAGSDGGWWLPLLTGRRSTLPPITYGSERADPADYAKQINSFGFALREHPLPSDEGIQLVRDAGIRYIYTGASSQQPDKIDVVLLRGHPVFTVVYDHAGVVILEMQPDH
jgi:hypothetical protein